MIKNVLVFIFLALTSFQLHAQYFDDWEARINPSLEYEINNRWSVEGKYYLYLDQNMSHYEKSVVGLEVEYKIVDWLAAGIDYRFGFDDNNHYHDIRYNLTFETKLFSKKWELEYRPMFQQKLEPGHFPDYFWRNRIKIKYEPADMIEIYASTETYLKIRDGLNFNTQKTALGIEFDITKQQEIGLEFNLKNKTKGRNYGRIELAYKFTIGG